MTTSVAKKQLINARRRNLYARKQLFKQFSKLPTDAPSQKVVLSSEDKENRKIKSFQKKALTQLVVNHDKRQILQMKQRNAKKRIVNFISQMNLFRKELVLKESAFKSYEMYNIPTSYHGIPLLPLEHEQFCENVRKMLMTTYRVFKRFVEKHGFTRSYVVLEIKIFKKKRRSAIPGDSDYIEEDYIEIPGYENVYYPSELSTMRANLGRVDTNSFDDFIEYNLQKASLEYEKISEYDYMYIYGIADSDINLLKYNPLMYSGGSYKDLPPCVKNTKSIINIKNKDEECFRWCLIAALYPQERDAERVTKYKTVEDPYDWSTVVFPMPISKIKYFERKNNISVNVYTLDEDGKTKVPLHISKEKHENCVNLFFYEGHYSLIKNFSRFCGGDHGSNHHFNCMRCLASYAYRESYLRHIEICEELNTNNSYVTMPSLIELKDKDGKKTGETAIPTTHFTDHKKQKRAPVVIYADFECSLQTCDNHDRKGVVAKHKANSFRLHIESDVDLGIPLEYEYSGDDCDVKFVELLILELEEKIQKRLALLLEKYALPKLTKEEENQFQKEDSCIFCKKEFTFKNVKVRDHCHFTGKYCGAAHQFCNMKAFQSSKGKVSIPVFFHNANYDLKCIISAFQKIEGENFVNKMGGIPCNMEVYKSVTMNSFSINCSFAHLTSSLDSLVKNLPDDKKVMLRTISGDNDEKFSLIKKKGLYPYEKIQTFEDIDFPISELKMTDFDSKLNLSKISFEDWKHVQEVIRVFGITNFKEYHDLYLKIDVFGLRDVFEYHRELTMSTYGLDPAHYIGLPQMTWQAGLKFTGVKLDQILDKDMYEMFEKMKRGGVSVISHKYAKANNKYLPDYNPDQEDTFLVQLDCNNLYGWAMCESLPTDGFEWAKPEDYDVEEIMKYQGDERGFTPLTFGETYGVCLEVDLEYPKELHDRDNDYPLAAEHLEINKHRKLAPNLMDKEKYVVHIANLKYYLEKGLILKKVHRVVTFNQSQWLKPYIDNNSALRQKAKNDFEKDYFKLMNNAFYGKTMENIRGRQNVQFCLTVEQFQKHTMSPLFCDVNVISPSLSLVKTHKKKVVLDKPIYIGACVLDFSKLLMYKFHMDKMKVMYPDCLMMKTDTDSLLYYIKTKDYFEDVQKSEVLRAAIEFSNFPKWHPLFETAHKKVPGWFQDECIDGGNGEMSVISEYVGLRAKSYSNRIFCYNKETGESYYDEKKKAKGVSNKHVKKRLLFDDYKNCLFDQKVISLGKASDKGTRFEDKIYSFRSFKMTMYSVEVAKSALNSKDDKRIPREENRFLTNAIGHWRSVA